MAENIIILNKKSRVDKILEQVKKLPFNEQSDFSKRYKDLITEEYIMGQN